MSINRCIDKQDMVHNTISYYLAIKKNEIMPFAATQMDLEIIIPSEASQRQISDDITHMWNLQYDTNELTYKTERDSQTWKTNLRLSYQRGKWWKGVNQGVWAQQTKQPTKACILE